MVTVVQEFYYNYIVTEGLFPSLLHDLSIAHYCLVNRASMLLFWFLHVQFQAFIVHFSHCKTELLKLQFK